MGPYLGGLLGGLKIPIELPPSTLVSWHSIISRLGPVVRAVGRPEPRDRGLRRRRLQRDPRPSRRPLPRSQGWVIGRTGLFTMIFSTVETGYKVAICSRGNISYTVETAYKVTGYKVKSLIK